MNDKAHSETDLNWLLDNLVERVVDARHAVVLSADGLLIGKSDGLSR
ncbi:MAG TPA: roadblock/LC7 domain-containing protein, partial [Kutzneria sp.]|nr:roadblock/LC7 domain-containing protein [Kutzneria sp.]